MSDQGRLRIIHCFRSPVGGIFRHVRDLIDEQVSAGHAVGVVCDNNTGGEFEEIMFSELSQKLELGLHRVPMERSIGPSDLVVLHRLYKTLKSLDVDVLHSHGAKGGAYARLIGTLLRRGRKRPARLYCPHGGSVHYDRSKFSGRVFFGLERLLERMTDRLIFVSEYERNGFLEKVGQPKYPTTLVYNGLRPQEFEPVPSAPDAADLLYIGMMRDLKGVDLFLNSLPEVARKAEQTVSAVLVGDGPDLERYRARAQSLPSNVITTFHDPMPARDAFALGKTLVVPSRAESMPYIVLEALAAKVPTLATNVGGIPEIFAAHSNHLIEPDNLSAMEDALAGHLAGNRARPPVDELATIVAEGFTTAQMAQTIMQAYRETLK